MKCLYFLALITFTSVRSRVIVERKSDVVEYSDKFLNNGEREATYSTVEMIQMEGYPAESHYVTTPDGYILNLHRIPYGKDKAQNNKVAYLQHGILASSSDWIIQGPGKSLGYILADAGYDVWLGNTRGNYYSRNHTTYNPDTDSDFWQFSWDEIGRQDLPTIIDHILDQTGKDGVYYAGHSQGSTAFYVMGSEKEEYNAKIKLYAHLAPIAFMSHMTSPLLQIVADWEESIEGLLNIIGMNEFLPGSGFLSDLTSDLCSLTIGKVLCKNTLFAICGFSENEMNMTLLPTIMDHTPAGASTKQMLHYAQLIKSGYFRQYDYGSEENLVKYGSSSPPDYNLDKVTAPGYLFYGNNDWLAAIVDVEELYGKLNNGVHKYLVGDSKFNHLDFTFGIDAANLVYYNVTKLFDDN